MNRSRKPPENQQIARFEPLWLAGLAACFALALVLRLYGQDFGADLDGPGTFRIVNFDEGGSCHAILGDFNYPRFLGYQMLWIADLQGVTPQPAARGAKAACHTRAMIAIQRGYSAVAGALSVVLLGLLALLMWPQRPAIAWTACALLGAANLHVAHSHWGTADVPQVFFTLLFTVTLALGIRGRSNALLWLSPILLIGAIWTKWYFFAVFAYAALLPGLDLRSSTVRTAAVALAAGLIAVCVFAWQPIVEQFENFSHLLWGRAESPFGTGYANIGTWRRWIRNAINLPLVHIVGLGLPATLLAFHGARRALGDRANRKLWLLQAPALVYACYMFALGPVTYYRHYLPLFPTVALLAAFGFWESRFANRRWLLAAFAAYPLLLTLDSERAYANDPRRAMRAWYGEHADARVLTSYYVVPPGGFGSAALFQMDRYLRDPRRYLASVDFVVLSENWYDTAFANELNGPIVGNPEGLIKTKPEYTVAYRRILSGTDPNLTLDAEFDLHHATPEFLLHRSFYGSFQLFIGDLKVYRVVR